MTFSIFLGRYNDCENISSNDYVTFKGPLQSKVFYDSMKKHSDRHCYFIIFTGFCLSLYHGTKNSGKNVHTAYICNSNMS